MILTYEDIYLHQSLLKQMILRLLPEAYCCIIMEKFIFDEMMAMNIKGIATVVIGIHSVPYSNSTTKQVMDIYNNGAVRPLNALGTLIEGVVYEFLFTKVVTEKERYKYRIGLIKQELIERVLV